MYKCLIPYVRDGAGVEPDVSELCPRHGCGTGTGDHHQGWQRTVTYVFDRCEHQWDITTDDPPVARRATSRS